MKQRSKDSKEIAELKARVKELEVENTRLRSRLRELDEEVEALGYMGYVASANRRKFHKPDCYYAEFILSSQNLIEFSSHREAEEAGYKPCGTCCA